MSAERLREAAALMRSRAALAAPGPWRATMLAYDPASTYLDSGSASNLIANGSILKTDADHIASWHPAVALAVADWLEDAASSVEACEESLRTNPPIDIRSYMVGTHIKAALAVADAYLGTPDP